jgi:ArsR family transcriptional regulator
MNEDNEGINSKSEESANFARIVESVTDNMLRDEILYDLADFYKVFGDSTRLKILCALLNHERCVGDISEAIGINQSAVSHQLRVLRQNDLVKFRKDGKIIFYSLDDGHVSALLEQGISHIMHKKIYDYSELN